MNSIFIYCQEKVVIVLKLFYITEYIVNMSYVLGRKQLHRLINGKVEQAIQLTLINVFLLSKYHFGTGQACEANDVFKDNEVYILANHFMRGITLGM